ncbi:MAG: DUF1697 domain-containing protein [Caulobacteraceae bacterium]
MALTAQVALLRAVNVGGRTATMAELRAMVAGMGLEAPRTLLQSGNLVFRGEARGPALEADIERAFEARFGFASDVIVRTREEWRAVIEANPLGAMAERDPAHLLVMPLKAAPAAEALAALVAWDKGPETIRPAGRALYIAYPDGVGRSKLTNALIERRLGVKGTARNWNTALKLAAMLEENG